MILKALKWVGKLWVIGAVFFSGSRATGTDLISFTPEQEAQFVALGSTGAICKALMKAEASCYYLRNDRDADKLPQEPHMVKCAKRYDLLGFLNPKEQAICDELIEKAAIKETGKLPAINSRFV